MSSFLTEQWPVLLFYVLVVAVSMVAVIVVVLLLIWLFGMFHA